MFHAIVTNRNHHPWRTGEICAVDRIEAMRRQENKIYHCNTPKQRFSQFEIITNETNIRVNNKWREKICSWYYGVVDYFNLSRQIVAISIDLLDRFFVERDHECDENVALLASLTTMFIAIKTHERKQFELCDIAQLCVGEFLPDDIRSMELEILKALKWMVNPPTTVEYIFHILKFLPINSHTPERTIFELSCYIAELSLFDSFLIGTSRSIIAFSAILNVLDYEINPFHCPVHYKEEFLNNLFINLDFDSEGGEINCVRNRLRSILSAAKV